MSSTELPGPGMSNYSRQERVRVLSNARLKLTAPGL